MKLKIATFLGMFLFLFSIISMPANAASDVILEVKTEINVGDELEVTIRCLDENRTAVPGNIKFKFDTAYFSFVSCNAADGVENNGVVTAYGKSLTVVLKAIAAGDSYMRADEVDGAGNSICAGGVTIKIHGDATVGGDEGDSEDENQGNTGTGEDEGNEGSTGEGNTGDEQEPPVDDGTVQETYLYIDNRLYYVTTEQWPEMEELGFEMEEIVVNNVLTLGMRYGNTSILLLHLIDGINGADMGYYVYDAESGNVCPYANYGAEVDAETLEELTSIQANYDKLFEKYDALKHKNRQMLIGIIIGVAAVLIALISFLLYKRHKEEEAYEMDYRRTDGGEPLKRQGEYLNAIANNSYKEDEGLPKDGSVGNAGGKKEGTSSTWSDMDTEDVEVIDLEDL